MKKILIALIILACTAALGWGQFYADLSMDERKDLAEAYYMAGEQYQSVGKTEKGKEFLTMAYRIYPDLEAGDIDVKKPIAKRSVSVTGSWRPGHSPIPEGVTAENAVLYYFSRFLRGFLTEDKTAMLSVIDSRLYVPVVPEGLPKTEVEARIDYFFLQYDVSETPPSDLLDLTSIRTEPVNRQIWKASIDTADDPAIDLRSAFGLSRSTLDFYLRIIGNRWVIFAAQALPEEVQRIVTPENAIRDTLVSAFQAFIEERPVVASRYFTDPLDNIPYDEFITREELQETFRGYFEDYDFAGYSDINVQLSIEKSPDLRHPGGPAYKVELTLPRDLRGEIPFWSTFSGYYMVFDERNESWRVFAIF